MEGVGIGIVDLKSLCVLWTVLNENRGEVDNLGGEIERGLENGGLMGVHTFKDDCFG